ncbi:MAG: phosphoenolpyruvate carboxykinase (ATP) [Acidobacteriaceae bacterium]
MSSAEEAVLDTRVLAQLTQGRVHRNLSVSQLVAISLARGESKLAANGALVAYTGARTGRSPRDKFIIQDDRTRGAVKWGKVNQPLEPEKFDALYHRVLAHLADRDVYVQDLFAGADPHYQMPVQIISEYAWHALFVHQLFLRPSLEDLATHVPEFTVIAAPEFQAVPDRDGTRSSAAILVDFTRKIVLIVGTKYAGEIKKSIFGILNFLLPQRDVFPMHCSANVGEDGVTALFFGLSGTGKTTLSADPYRRLIGDDEHGWGPNGVFNFEGGCYAKCVDLSKEKEPQIYHAIRFGAVLENVALDSETCEPDYHDVRFTENTRAAYPIDYIQNALVPSVGGHPKNILFLTADAFGVLPPISKLTPEQAMYHFLSGYTAKLAGTETGMGSEPVPDFSTCFGAPFMPLPPRVYAAMLGDRLRQHQAQCWLVNTGWTGGAYGVGKRMGLPHTRAMVHAVLDEKLADVEFVKEPTFGFNIPTSYPGVPYEILNPRNMWKDRAAYDRQATMLAAKFKENFVRFDVPDAIRNAGPQAQK